MTSDEIMQAFSVLARGFPNHPDVRTLADKLSEVFSGWVAPAAQPVDRACVHGSPENVECLECKPVTKRAPGRPKKAE